MHTVQVCTVCISVRTLYVVTGTPTRREANKMRTRAALADAMYHLIETEGPDVVTAERVAEAAGISRRTFFNYYESVDALIAAGAEYVLTAVRAALATRPPDEPVIDAAYAVIADLFTADFLAEAVRAWQAVDLHPAARRFALDASVGHASRLVHELGRERIDPEGADPMRSSLLITVLLAAFEEARDQWLHQHSGAVDEASVADLLTYVHRAFDIIRPAFEQS